MKKHTLYLLFLACCMAATPMHAQSYFVSSLATPGAATFSAGQDKNGVLSIPFGAATRTFEVETNQECTASCDADWCQASIEGKTLTLNVTQNDTEEARNAILSIRSKDFHPLFLTLRQEARLTFAVISDVHVGNSVGEGPLVKVPQALRHLTNRGKLDALAVVGDLTDGAKPEQYTKFVEIFGSDENILNPVDQFLFMMGNHDNYDASGKNNYQVGLKPFNAGKPYPYHQYHLIKGYPFITLSDFGSANNDINNSSAAATAYPQSSVDKLEKMLKQAAAEAPGKPIFVFTHVPPSKTCYSSWADFENGEAWSMSVLNPVLNKYPQAVVFAGHSHYPLGDPRSIHQGTHAKSKNQNFFTAINTASTTYSEIHPKAVDVGIHPENYEYVTEGMILVEQPNGDIEVRRYDTYRDVEIDPEHRWVLKAPFDGSMFQYADIRDANDNPNNIPLRDGLPAPAFAEDATLKVEATSFDAKVSFPQATDNECVFRYHVRVTKGKTVVKDSYIFSQFYLTKDMPETLSFSLEKLKPENEYAVEVTAYDSYDNISEALTTTFTTPAEDDPANDVPEATGCWTFDDPNDLLSGTGVATLQGAMKEMGVVVGVDALADAGIMAVEGPAEGNGAITVPVNSGLKMTSHLDAQSLSSYTLLLDIHLTTLDGYTALYQNDLTNKKDGSFFAFNGQLGLNSNGLGYGGSLTAGAWHRVLFVVKDNVPTVYLDGKMVAQAASANATNWQMSTDALFFMDDGDEEHQIETAEIRFWDSALSEKHAAKLGSVSGSAPEPELVPEATGCWTFDNADDLLVGTGVATLKGTTHPTAANDGKKVTVVDDLAAAGIVPVTGPTSNNGAILLPKGTSLLMDANLDATSIGTYSVMFDVLAKDCSTYIPLLQNSMTDAKDGSLFINKYQVGLGGQLGYYGSIQDNHWYRIVFVVEPKGATLYVDGVKFVSKLNITDSYDRHWLLTTGALFFADDNGEEKDIQAAELRFWNVALTTAQVQQLGAVPVE